MQSYKQLAGDCYLIMGADDTGRMAWYHLQTDKRRKPMVEKAIKDKLNVELTELGTILDSGYGEPPKALLDA